MSARSPAGPAHLSDARWDRVEPANPDLILDVSGNEFHRDPGQDGESNSIVVEPTMLLFFVCFTGGLLPG